MLHPRLARLGALLTLIVGAFGALAAGAPAQPVAARNAAKKASRPFTTPAATGILKKGDRVAIVGDSITEQKIYSRFIETYLLACLPQLDLRLIQLGWSGEAAPGLLARLDNDLLPWYPSVVTLCYGMNDGCYQPYDDEIGKRFAANMAKIVAKLKTAGATVVVGSPGIVDPNYFPPPYIKSKGKTVDSKTYNENLARLSAMSRNLSVREGFPFADVYTPMMKVTKKFKADFGDKAIVAGVDGIHPWDDGHLVMAYAFLKAMGIKGEIGAIELDVKSGQATASEGHRVIVAGPDRVELESVRYPFCFAKTNSTSNGTSWSARMALPALPFNQDLNRLTLRVRGLEKPRATVRWGEASKSFTREQLDKGINLAAEFLDNPFSEPFARVDAAVAAKEKFETHMIKDVVTKFRAQPKGEDAKKDPAELKKTQEETRAQLEAEDGKLHDAARATIQPVRHTIAVTAE